MIRAQAETCYGQEIGENKTKLLRVCHLLRPGSIQEIHHIKRNFLRKKGTKWHSLVNIIYVIPAHKTKTNNDWGGNFEEKKLRIAFFRIVL